jgi:hypothetical protein
LIRRVGGFHDGVGDGFEVIFRYPPHLNLFEQELFDAQSPSHGGPKNLLGRVSPYTSLARSCARFKVRRGYAVPNPTPLLICGPDWLGSV